MLQSAELIYGQDLFFTLEDFLAVFAFICHSFDLRILVYYVDDPDSLYLSYVVYVWQQANRNDESSTFYQDALHWV